MPERARFVTKYVPTPQEKVLARQVQRAGSSPWRRQVIADPDTSVQTECQTCGARFVATGARTAAANLAQHLTAKHSDAPRPRRSKAAP